MAASVHKEGKIKFENSGSKWEAQRFWFDHVSLGFVDPCPFFGLTVAWTTVLVRTSPRDVDTVIQPSLSFSETFKTGVLA